MEKGKKPIFMEGKTGWKVAIFERGFVVVKDKKGITLSSHYEKQSTQADCVEFYRGEGWKEIPFPGGIWV